MGLTIHPELEAVLDNCEALIKSSVASDVVDVDLEELKNMGIYDNMEPSAELLIANTVPITDIEIKMLYPGCRPVTARFVVEPVFADYFNNADDYKNEKGETPIAFVAMALAFQIRNDFKQVVMPIMVNIETGKFEFPAGASLVGPGIKNDRVTLDGEGGKFLVASAIDALQAWYFIQVCLTNPPIRERFAALSKTKTVPKGDTQKKRGAVRYVKTHYLDPEEWGIIKRTESGRTYSCLAWYVIGHWREYKNGHRVFIKPYWKGTMRNSVEEAGDVSRNRIVAQIEKAVV